MSSFSLSSLSTSVSTSFPHTLPIWAASKSNKTKANVDTGTIYYASLSLQQLRRLNAKKLHHGNFSRTSFTSNQFNQDFEQFDTLSQQTKNFNDENVRLIESNPIVIHIYIRIPIKMTLGNKKINWLWVDTMPENGEERYSPFSNESPTTNGSIHKNTVLQLKMSSPSIGKNLNTNNSTKIEALKGVKFLQYSYNSSGNTNLSLAKNTSNSSKAKVSVKNKETETNSSYAYLKLAIVSAKNLSVLNLQGLTNSLKLELTFFQSEIINTSCKEDEVPSSSDSSASIQNCIHKLLQVVYVINNNPNTTFSKRSFIQNNLKVMRQSSGKANTTKVLENYKLYNQSNKEVVSIPFQTKLKKFKEFISPKVIHYPAKSRTISSLNIPLFKIVNNNRSDSPNKKSALRTSNSHQSKSDLEGNVETLLSSKSLQPSPMSSPVVDNRKNIFKEIKQKKTNDIKSILKSQQKLSKKLENKEKRTNIDWEEIMCKDWLDITTSSSIVEISYDSNIDPENHINGEVNASKPQSETTTTNHNLYNGDKEFNKAGIKIILPKTRKESLNSSVQLYCAAQIRLPHGYWPNIKVTVIQGKPNGFE